MIFTNTWRFASVRVKSGSVLGFELVGSVVASSVVVLMPAAAKLPVPVGNTIDLVYRTLRLRAELPLAPGGMLGAVLGLGEGSRLSVRTRYPRPSWMGSAGRVDYRVSVPRGWSVLEASRANGLPRLSQAGIRA